jgi:hypothetical protein
VLEERPEPGREEHHLGHDEHDEAVAQAEPHDRRVVALLAFGDHVGPPAVHDVEHGGEADQEQPRARPVHPVHRAEEHREGARRAISGQIEGGRMW